MNNMPIGAFYDRNNPINDKPDYRKTPTSCPMCGRAVIESNYWYECSDETGDCDWTQEKELQDDMPDRYDWNYNK